LQIELWQNREVRSGDSSEHVFQRSYRALVVLVALYVPVVGIAGFLGWAFLHSLVVLWVCFVLYFAAIAIYGLRAYQARPRS
jgi:hypothetical protein